MRIHTVALAVLTLLAARHAEACSMTMSNPPVQLMMRQSAVVAEVTAIDANHRFSLVKAWKGSPAQQISREHEIEPGSSCHSPTIPGATYFLFIGCNRGKVAGEFRRYECRNPSFIALEQDVAGYLRRPKRITRAEVISKLHSWMDGAIPDADMVKWLAETKRTAVVDDWVRFGWREISVTLEAVRKLAMLTEIGCDPRVLRTQFLPDLLPMIRERRTGVFRQVRALEEFFIEVPCK